MDHVTEHRDRLAREDTNFRRLVTKHHEYEERLADLRSRRYLSEEEKLEEVKLKKRKLVIKDHMEELIRAARS